jgi:hypothetical protein
MQDVVGVISLLDMMSMCIFIFNSLSSWTYNCDVTGTVKLRVVVCMRRTIRRIHDIIPYVPQLNKCTQATRLHSEHRSGYNKIGLAKAQLGGFVPFPASRPPALRCLFHIPYLR